MTDMENAVRPVSPCACTLHVYSMDSMATLQIRDIPEDIRRTLKARAAAAGMSLSEYALAELSRSARYPTMEELIERIRLRGGVTPTTRAADILRAERDGGIT